jgi:predicted transcriptional regulator
LPSPAELLFELGSEDRLKILGELNRNPMKLSQLAQTMSSTIQETSRQCSRLEEAGLVERLADGKFSPTGVGKIVLSLSPAFELLSNEKEYFKTHDGSVLPLSFIERIGEVSEHKQINHINDTLNFQRSVVAESREFILFMSDQPVGHSIDDSHSHFSPTTKLQIILPKSVDTGVFQKARKNMESRLQIGVVDEVKILLAISEKVAAFSLPTLDGRLDYSRGFIGESASFRKWCQDLFTYFWEGSQKKYLD